MTAADTIARAKAGKLAPKPSSLTFEQAAAMPVSGVTALQARAPRGASARATACS